MKEILHGIKTEGCDANRRTPSEKNQLETKSSSATPKVKSTTETKDSVTAKVTGTTPKTRLIKRTPTGTRRRQRSRQKRTRTKVKAKASAKSNAEHTPTRRVGEIQNQSGNAPDTTNAQSSSQSPPKARRTRKGGKRKVSKQNQSRIESSTTTPKIQSKHGESQSPTKTEVSATPVASSTTPKTRLIKRTSTGTRRRRKSRRKRTRTKSQTKTEVSATPVASSTTPTIRFIIRKPTGTRRRRRSRQTKTRTKVKVSAESNAEHTPTHRVGKIQNQSATVPDTTTKNETSATPETTYVTPKNRLIKRKSTGTRRRQRSRLKRNHTKTSTTSKTRTARIRKQRIKQNQTLTEPKAQVGSTAASESNTNQNLKIQSNPVESQLRTEAVSVAQHLVDSDPRVPSICPPPQVTRPNDVILYHVNRANVLRDMLVESVTKETIRKK